nr:hypothetical protein [uncultured Rhodoferax sp.]
MIFTYIAPEIKTPVGGIKVLYRHSETLSQNNVESCIFHPNDPDFFCTWFKHDVNIRTHRPFSPLEDFLIIPEIWAVPYGLDAIKKHIPYTIFVQNGYLIAQGSGGADRGILDYVYENATVITSISDDASKCINMAFPSIPHENICRLLPNIGEVFLKKANDPFEFEIRRKKKKNVISYMTRKLNFHSTQVLFFLERSIPPGWQFIAIDGKSEDEVSLLMDESSIFLSFSELEGFGLPPVEAALSGNLVIGYTGGAGAEYFSNPLFRAIASGDVQQFTSSILQSILLLEAATESSWMYSAAHDLANHYSRQNQTDALKRFVQIVQDSLGA